MLNQDSIAIGIGFTQQDFTAPLVKYDYPFSPGDIVAGTVLRLELRGALIDIGAKVSLDSDSVKMQWRECLFETQEVGEFS
jgi:small subunit ribosomal protein S1